MKLNGNIMLDTMSDVNEKLIMESDFMQNSEAADKKIKKKFFITGAAITAVMAAAAIAVTFIPWKSENHVVLPDLPMLTVSESNVPAPAQGFSAVGVDELDQIKESVREQDFNISEMPVYNSSSISADTSDKIKAKLKETVEYFGLDYNSMRINDNTIDQEHAEEFKKKFKEEYKDVPDEELERMVRVMRAMADIAAYTPDDDTSGIGYISVHSDMSVCIFMDDKSDITIPADYSFGDDSTYEELEAAGRYLLNEYSELINISDPVFRKNTDFTGVAEFYEKGTNTAESIANQSIKHVEFYGENNKLKIIRIYEEYTLCEKIADYPIISEEEAEKLLRNGNYLSTINETMYILKEEDEIGLALLTYRSGQGYECIMPFYEFWVKLPEEEFGHEKGDLLYGSFYVPAVRGEYLENMPAPAISYNGAMIS